MSNRRQDHYEERAAQKVSDANQLLKAGGPTLAERCLWQAAELLTKARLAA